MPRCGCADQPRCTGPLLRVRGASLQPV